MEIEEYARCLTNLTKPGFTSLTKTEEEILKESAKLLLTLKENLTYMLAFHGYQSHEFELFKSDFPC